MRRHGSLRGAAKPFVSVILSASDRNGVGPLGPSLQAILGLDYPAFEVVVAAPRQTTPKIAAASSGIPN